MRPEIEIAARSDPGRQRRYQEDAFGHPSLPLRAPDLQKGVLLIVADGVGGHKAGDEASRVAVETIQRVFREEWQEDVHSTLDRAVSQANAEVYRRASGAGKEGMATTIVCTVIRGGEMSVAHVGDSRAYLLRAGVLEQITEDHSWVRQQIAMGVLTEEMARTHRRRHVLTRSLGTKPDVQVDIDTVLLEDGDRVLLCTDGLYELVEEETIAEMMQQPPEVATEKLVHLANEAGGTDNITVLIATVHFPDGRPAPEVVQARATERSADGEEESTMPHETYPKDEETAPRPAWTADDVATMGELKTSMDALREEVATVRTAVQETLSRLDQFSAVSKEGPPIREWEFEGYLEANDGGRLLSFPPVQLPNGVEVACGAEMHATLKSRQGGERHAPAPWALVLWLRQSVGGDVRAEDRRLLVSRPIIADKFLLENAVQLCRAQGAALTLFNRAGDALALQISDLHALVFINRLELKAASAADRRPILLNVVDLCFRLTWHLEEEASETVAG